MTLPPIICVWPPTTTMTRSILPKRGTSSTRSGPSTTLTAGSTPVHDWESSMSMGTTGSSHCCTKRGAMAAGSAHQEAGRRPPRSVHKRLIAWALVALPVLPRSVGPQGAHRPLVVALLLLLGLLTIPSPAIGGAPGGNTEALDVYLNGTGWAPTGIADGTTVLITITSTNQSGTVENITVNESLAAGSVDGGYVVIIESVPAYGPCNGGVPESVRVKVRDDGLEPDTLANDSVFYGLLTFVDDGGVNGSATDMAAYPPILDVRCGGNVTIDGDLDLDGSGENQTFDVDTQPPQLLSSSLPTYLTGDLDLS